MFTMILLYENRLILIFKSIHNIITVLNEILRLNDL